MFKYSENNRDIIESDEGFSIETQSTNAIIYKELGKSLKLYRESLAGSRDVLIAGEIKKWDSGQPIDTPARERLLNNVRRAFAFTGTKISFHITDSVYIDGKSAFQGDWPGRC
jgi:hypothetical protein